MTTSKTDSVGVAPVRAPDLSRRNGGRLEADYYGNYYLYKKGQAPCLLRFTRYDSPDRGKYFVLTEEGALFDPTHRLFVFDTPEQALEALERHERRVTGRGR